MSRVRHFLFVCLILLCSVYPGSSVAGAQSARRERPSAAPTVGELVQVEVTVPPKAQSIKTWLTASPARPVVNQNQVIAYTFAYQSTNTSPIPLTLQVTWGLGTSHGLGEDDIPGLEYQVGSASSAYGGAPPVVDLSARTITWQISDLPAGERQEVQFKLKTSDSYQGAGLVTFPIEGSVLSIDGVPVARAKIGYVYKPPTPNQDGPQRLSEGLSFSDISVKAVNDTSAQIGVAVNQASAHLQLKFGDSPDNLTQSALVTAISSENIFLLTNLVADTTTYFQVTAETSDQAIQSDVFSISTAARPTQAVLRPWLLTIAHKNQVLRRGGVRTVDLDDILKIEQREELDISLNLPDSPDIHTVEVMFKGPDLSSVRLNEVAPGTFATKVKLPTTLGRYEIMSQITDTFGNRAETRLQEFDLRPALRVVDAETGEPLPGAEVTLYKENAVTGGFDKISDVGMLATNPIEADDQGLLPISRQPGKYKAEVHVVGYRPEQVVFELDEPGVETFPQIEMETAGAHWFGRLRYRLKWW